jgi:hypothetical protein
MKSVFKAILIIQIAIMNQIQTFQQSEEFKEWLGFLEQNPDLEQKAIAHTGLFGYLNGALPTKELCLKQNLRLAQAFCCQPAYLLDAFFHARNRCYWILASLNAWPGVLELEREMRPPGPERPYNNIHIDARRLLHRMYTTGGFGLERNQHLANTFLRHQETIPAPSELITTLETELPFGARRAILDPASQLLASIRPERPGLPNEDSDDSYVSL